MDSNRSTGGVTKTPLFGLPREPSDESERGARRSTPAGESSGAVPRATGGDLEERVAVGVEQAGDHQAGDRADDESDEAEGDGSHTQESTPVALELDVVKHALELDVAQWVDRYARDLRAQMDPLGYDVEVESQVNVRTPSLIVATTQVKLVEREPVA
jgi:hypothetical protein